MRRIRRHLTPGLALGVVAIVVALAGTSVALPGKNSVDAGDLKKNSVAKTEVAKNAIGSEELGGVTTTAVSVGVPSGTNGELTATCPSGQAIGGGVKWDNPNVQNDNTVNESYLSGNGWYARGENQSGVDRTLTVEVYCLGV
jgi:hypothetical protein